MVGSFSSSDGFGIIPPLVIGGNVINRPLVGPSEGFIISYTVPRFTIPPHTSAGFLYTAPFTAIGNIVVRLPGQTSTFTTFSFEGAGTVVAEFQVRPPNNSIPGYNQFDFIRATYTFGPVAPNATITPVPEPASMVLLGTGLAGFVGSVVRKRRRR